MTDILFICKTRQGYGTNTADVPTIPSYERHNSGLWNSTRFIVQALNQGRSGSDSGADIIEVVDNNDIDRWVAYFNPKIVVIEALWVVPEKFYELQKLHPNVKWFVHLHSNIPFLAMEGIAIEWINEYSRRGVGLITNSKHSTRALQVLYGLKPIYLPNVYISRPRRSLAENSQVLSVGCFGAIRPMKNQLIQAMAAISYARKEGKFLLFHVNASRVETGGNPVLKNLRALFNAEPNAVLWEHDWFEPKDFIDYLHVRIDIGLQVSLSETFNVVTADYVTAGVPIVVSKEIEWASCLSKAEANSVPSIVKAMKRAHNNRPLVMWNQRRLKKYADKAIEMWVRFLKEETS